MPMVPPLRCSLAGQEHAPEGRAALQGFGEWAAFPVSYSEAGCWG